MDARKNILIKMVARKCGLESHSASLRQRSKYVCGVVMKFGNSFLCVSSKFFKNVLRFTVCAIIGKPKDRLVLANCLRAGTCYFLRPWIFFIES